MAILGESYQEQDEYTGLRGMNKQNPSVSGMTHEQGIAYDNLFVEAKLIEDRALFGNSYHTVDLHGKKTRIDPTTVRLVLDKDDKVIGYSVLHPHLYTLDELVKQ